VSGLLQLEVGRHVVGIAELRALVDPAASIVTYALGSCLGVALFDPVARVGGLLHAMLPDSSLDPARAASNPERFVDTGVPRLFRACYALGARKERLLLRVAGAASVHDEAGDSFRIGQRNLVRLRKLLWKNGVIIHGEDVGGTLPRTMTLHLATGDVVIRSNGVETRL